MSLKERLTKILEKLQSNEALLAKARRRHKRFRERAEHNHAEQILAQEEGKHDKADRCEHRALRAHNRAVYWKGKVKQQIARVHHLDQSKGTLEKEIAEEKAKHKVSVVGNKVTGGTPNKRLKVAALAAANNPDRHSFYSQSGAWDVDHCITGEKYGERSDCSSWVTSAFKSSGLPDPNQASYTGGYTGTLVSGAAKQLNKTSTPRQVCVVIYGPGVGHHTELCLGDGDGVTVGHGSAPVDKGIVDLFGDGDYRLFVYDGMNKKGNK